MKSCPKCGIEHSKTGKFCSRSCANSRGPRSVEVKEKISAKLKGIPSPYKGKQRIERETRTCPICKTAFTVMPSSTKIYCSLKCNPNMGGYREGAGNSLSGYYKGIYCNSTYELVWVIFNLDHGMEVVRFPNKLTLGDTTYIPDFIQDGVIIEIKGYERQEFVERKTKVANHFGYDVVVLRKEDLKTHFEWVNSHYKFNSIDELYDDFKPRFEYDCDWCGATFNRFRKIKTETKFCSRTCAGDYRANKRWNKGTCIQNGLSS